MRVVQINGGVFGSTGMIMFGITEALKKNGNKCSCLAPVTNTNRDKEPDCGYEKIGTFNSRRLNVLFDRITGLAGCFSYFTTRKVVKKIKRFSPDIIQLHNIHGGFINIPMLFTYIKKSHVAVVWTLHDCWAFTGHCPHYDMIGCDKWRRGCYSCPQRREYPQSLLDSSRLMYFLKKKWFSGIPGMTLVTPSVWLASQVKQSFLKDYPVKIIHNGIDLEIFKPTLSDFRKKHEISDEKYIVLGVAFDWGTRKGLDVFIELSKRLDKEKYQIVLVGTNDTVDRQLPDEIISVHRTQNQKELAEIYTVADIFVIPTREESYPTVNMEAIACGTPVLTFNTGGSPEILDATCGDIVARDDINAVEKEIVRICEMHPYSEEACVHRAKKFDKNKKYMEYVELYESIVAGRSKAH